MKILVIDPQPLLLLGCRTLFSSDANIVLFDAGDGATGYDVFVASNPDVTLVEFHLPDVSGLALARRMLTRDPSAGIILTGDSDDPLFASQSLDAGARGYVSKRDEPAAMLRAVYEVASGGVAVSASMAKRIVSMRMREGESVRLTPREREILRLLAVGRSMAEIADVVNLSYKTVAANCMKLRAKLHARTTVELVHVAGMLGLL